jgi:hypothetical protein
MHVINAGESVHGSFVPVGTGGLCNIERPALKRWAIIDRPAGLLLGQIALLLLSKINPVHTSLRIAPTTKRNSPAFQRWDSLGTNEPSPGKGRKKSIKPALARVLTSLRYGTDAAVGGQMARQSTLLRQ